MKLSGSRIIIEMLIEQGVDTVFGYPGGAIMPLYDALYDAPLRHVLTVHEQGAAHAADGYARASGRVGVCIATSGPGATNLTTGPGMIVSYDGVQFDETGQNKNAGIVIVQVANVDGKPDRVTVWPKSARRAGYVPAFPANK